MLRGHELRDAALGRARGWGYAVHALLLAAATGRTVHRYAPSQVKAAVANYGAGNKAQIQRAVQLVLGLGPSDAMGEDASDALAIGLCHIQYSRTASITGVPAGLHRGRSR